MVNNVPPDQIPRLRGNPNLHVIAVPSNRVMFVTLRTDRKPFNDRRVRQAMNYAIDREAITQGIFSGMAPVAKAPLPSEAPSNAWHWVQAGAPAAVPCAAITAP